jgi:hypothetical protein
MIRGAMDESSWTGIVLGYMCPTCGKSDQQKFVLEGASYNKSVLNKVRDQMASCRLCKAIPPQGTKFLYDITVGTLQQLRNAGYPTPSVH